MPRYARAMSSTSDGNLETFEPGPGGASRLAMDAVCPLLRSRDGAWSSAFPSAELQCWAVRPSVPLAVAKQRDQCLAIEHLDCATYVAATGVGGEGPSGDHPPSGVPGLDAARLWPETRPVPLALEPVRTLGRLRMPDAIGGQVLLAGLMTAALVIFVVARAGAPATNPNGQPTPAPTLEAVVTASPLAAPTPTPRLAPTPSPAITPGPTPTAAPTPTIAPTATPKPTQKPTPSGAARTYTVQKGDTLWAISVKFGVTVSAIQKANHMATTVVHRGDVLIIP